MCGIYGIASLNGEQPARDDLRRMAAVTVHRGPDDEGSYMGAGIALGMRRLSIIDLAGGHQPISNADDTLWVICNGEIYNFRELRAQLETAGHVFKTKSDTEVVLHAYAEYGERCVERLGGMFAFALWDARHNRLLLGRDRLGIKPIYYYEDGRRLIFASEAKAILAVPGVPREIDPAALHQYLSLGYVPAPLSIFRGIRKLPVASFMVIEGGEVRVRRYWDLPAVDDSRTEAQWIDELRGGLERAVVSQMVSDVPLGAFLSGGIDSSATVAFMARHSTQPVKTYSIGFDTGPAGTYYNELPYARQVAARFGTDHREILVRPDVVGLLPRLLWHMDEPIADSAFLTTYLVAQFARQDVAVILSGVGGDELFGGYRRYLDSYYDRLYRRVPGALRRHVLRPLAERLPADRHSRLLDLSRLARNFVLARDLPFDERYRAYVGVFAPDAVSSLKLGTNDGRWDPVLETFKTAGHRDDQLRALLDVDLATQLPDDLLLLTDKMTMATSLECRVPLLDHELVELAARMPSHFRIRGRELKYVLKKALAGILPEDILRRPKRGFGAPLGAWIKHELAPFTRRLLSAESVSRRGLLRPDVVADTIAVHQANRGDRTDHLLALINLEVWCRIYLDGRTPADLSAELTAEAGR
jgi:asparagine synthase (glutamine-hydrolysing)